MSSVTKLLSGRLIARNVLWNLAGMGLPLLVAIWSIPVLIEGMGTARFGLLSIIWMGIGYFSLFDLGIGRALTQMVSERVGKGQEAELTSLIKSGLALMFLLGIIATIIVVALTPILTQSIFKIEPELKTEALWSFWILGVSLPFVISSAGLTGILQAYQRFPEIALVRILLGVSNFVGPVLMLYLTPSLIATTAVLAFCRIIAWVGYRQICRMYMQSGAGAGKGRREHIKKLLSYGGWITISNLISPMMTYFDRFLIASLMSMSFVAYYTVPYDVIVRVLVIPDALSGVLFPALAMAMAARSEKARQIFFNADRLLLLVMFPLLSCVVLFASEGLTWWLGEKFANHSVVVLLWLSMGVFVNSQARMPYLTLQGAGRPDITAKLHLLEIIPYLACLWYGIQTWGIAGAAAVWTLRVVIDTALLYWLSMRQSPMLRKEHQVGLILTMAGAVGLGFLMLVEIIFLKLALIFAIAVVCGSLALITFQKQLKPAA